MKNNGLHALNRLVIQVEGEDAKTFLQGLLTNNVSECKKESLQYSFFLTPQGRYLTDLFISGEDNNYMLDVSAIGFETIITKFNLYKLRSKVNITKLDIIPHISKESDMKDPRIQSDFLRYYDSNDRIFDESLLQAYDNFRFDNFLPDGERDFIFDKSLILNLGAAKFNGVSFSKGCYVGQVVTARMHNRDAVRKKTAKVRYINKPIIELGTEVFYDNNKVGIALSYNNNEGLLLLNSEILGVAKIFNVGPTEAEILKHA